MKLYFMLAYTLSKADRPILAEVIEHLSDEGFEVSTGVAETLAVSPERLRVEADLYILKSHSSLWLNLAAVLDAQQARILNSYNSCSATNNKIRTTSHLTAAEIPIPRSWVTGDLALIPEVTDAMPLMIKPNVGRSGNGIRIIQDEKELVATRIEDGMFVQELVTPEDEINLYVIGERVFGIRKHHDNGGREAVVVEPLMEDLALRCGRALGLEIYGLDVVIGGQGPVVVDVNYFPSFKGVPAAALQLADYIGACARR